MPKHVLQFTQSARVQSGVPDNSCMMFMGLLSTIIDVELRIDRGLDLWRHKRTNSVNELSMQPKRVRPSTLLVERVIQLSPHISHGKGIVVVANVLAKLLAKRLLRVQEL